MVFGSIFSNNFGLLNAFLQSIGLTKIEWLTQPWGIKVAIASIVTWRWVGYNAIIFLAGLRQIPVMYHEAAAVDGASRWTRFRRITLPLLSPIVFFNLVLQLIGAFQSFTQAFIVSNGTGGPADSTLFYSLYLYQRGFGQFEMGYAAAMAWLLVVIVGALTAINFFLSKYWVFYDD